jgi:beta-lactamase regulating signal transducer with metallopeptidase domain
MNMVDLTNRYVIAWLTFVADWSVRWGIVLAIGLLWLALKPPRDAASRYLVCIMLLIAGMILPLVPRWAQIPVPRRSGTTLVEAPEASPVAPLDLSSFRLDVSSPVSDPHERNNSTPAITGQALQATLPQSSLGARQWASLTIGGLWALAVSGLSFRLIVGRIVLVRLRREAVDVGVAARSLLDDCRRAMSLTRPVVLAIHSSVSSPVTFGGRVPMIVVPADWDSWTYSNRRASLIHELAHVARRDDFTKLAQEVIRAPFFFHPMVHWLLTRLDRERELLCDEAAVALGADPLAYARLLFDLAQRPARLLPFANDHRCISLSFLDRGTVAARIERLLDENMSRTNPPPSRRRRIALATSTVCAAVIAGGIGIGTAHPSPTVDDRAAKVEVKVQPKAPPARHIKGVVLDPDGKPAVGAVVVAGILDATRNHEVFTTDQEGRFIWSIRDGAVSAYFVAHKEGLAPAFGTMFVDAGEPGKPTELKLGKSAPFSATIVDTGGHPVSGARVRVEMFAVTSSSPRDANGISTVSTCYEYVRREVIDSSPLQAVFETFTDQDGLFTLSSVGPESWLKLGLIAQDGAAMLVRAENEVAEGTIKTMFEAGFVVAPPGKSARLMATPAARITGSVVTKVPGVNLAGLTIFYQASRTPGDSRQSANIGGRNIPIGPDGQFTIDGLSEGTINVVVVGNGEADDWTYRAANDVPLKSGEASEVVLELIRGVLVEGRVVAQGSGTAIAGAGVGVYGPFRPRTGAMTRQAKTDAQGRYHYRLPAGETYLYVMAPPEGFTRLTGNSSAVTVVIPAGVDRYEVPPLELAAAVTVRGRVLDTAGSPVAGATIVGICEGNTCRPWPGQARITDVRGEFQLPPGEFNTVARGTLARLLVRLRDGTEQEAATVPGDYGFVTIKVPARISIPPGVAGPHDVLPDELAGVVVDTQGTAIEGVDIDAWTWYPGNETRTNARGEFRLKRLGKNAKVQLVFRKPGYSPQLFFPQPTGTQGWVVVLDNKTYFEGQVTGPDDKPVARALIRANQGPKRSDGYLINEIWTEALTDADGRYRMFAQADVYDIQVRVPGVGVARLPKSALGIDEARRLDIALLPAVTFRAKVVDSLTGKPIVGLRLWNWQHPGIEGRSGEDGIVTIADMLPGTFNFLFDAPDYARWWSDQSTSPWGRRQIHPGRAGRPGWQRNFDPMDFDLRPGMAAVTITLEQAAKITGEVRDPDGKTVAGATVAPTMSGTSNSLTGDTRFSVITDASGRFSMPLPASGDREYNLLAHDGKYEEWRQWANGIHRPFSTKPGERLAVVLQLSRPARVRGRVTDPSGNPIAGHKVRASAMDGLESHYYDPIVETGADGSYELKFLRPGEQYVQVAPFTLFGKPVQSATRQTVKLESGETKDGVDFQAETKL